MADGRTNVQRSVWRDAYLCRPPDSVAHFLSHSCGCRAILHICRLGASDFRVCLTAK